MFRVIGFLIAAFCFLTVLVIYFDFGDANQHVIVVLLFGFAALGSFYGAWQTFQQSKRAR